MLCVFSGTDILNYIYYELIAYMLAIIHLCVNDIYYYFNFLKLYTEILNLCSGALSHLKGEFSTQRNYYLAIPAMRNKYFRY